MSDPHIVVSDDDEVMIDEGKSSTRPPPAPRPIPRPHMRNSPSYHEDETAPLDRLSQMFPFVSLPMVSFLFSQHRHQPAPPPPPSHTPAQYRLPVDVPPPPRLRTPMELLASASKTPPTSGSEEVVDLDSESVASDEVAFLDDNKLKKESNGSSTATGTSAATDVPVERHNAVVFDELRKAIKCAVCLENMVDMTATKCGHLFCKECIHAAISAQHKCPTCRAKLNYKDTHPLFL